MTVDAATGTTPLGKLAATAKSRITGLRRLLSRAQTIRHEHGISYARQLRDYQHFHGTIGMSRAEFYNYWLWDVKRPLQDRMTFLSNVERRAIEYRMNPRAPSLAVSNKGWATVVLQDAGIPVGEVLCLLTMHPGVTPSTESFLFRRGEAGVADLLTNAPVEGIVLKPDDGGSGRSVHVFRRADSDGLVALDGTPWSLAQLLTTLRTERLWKIERRILQHPELAAIAGDTLGTLRLITFRTLDGGVHITPPVWKIPVGLSGVDHFSHGVGSLAAAIDPSTGRLGRARGLTSLAHTDEHPLTGRRITGALIPHWSAAREVATRIAECFPDLASLGYDIAITSDGPVVIEVNSCWGERPTQAAIPQGLVQGMFRKFLEERGYGDVVNLEARSNN